MDNLSLFFYSVPKFLGRLTIHSDRVDYRPNCNNVSMVSVPTFLNFPFFLYFPSFPSLVLFPFRVTLPSLDV